MSHVLHVTALKNLNAPHLNISMPPPFIF